MTTKILNNISITISIKDDIETVNLIATNIISDVDTVLLTKLNTYITTFIKLKKHGLFVIDDRYNYHKNIQDIREQYEKYLQQVLNEVQRKEDMIIDLKKQHADEINTLYTKLNQCMNNVDTIVNEKVNTEFKHIKDVFVIKEEFYKNIIQELKENNVSISTLQKNNELIINMLSTPKSAITIGNEGELFIQDLLTDFTKYNTSSKVENVSGNVASGDIKFIYNNLICCIEVKNIVEDIGSNHINKFIRDMDSKIHNYNCGIFISLKSNFTIKSNLEDMQVHIINNKPIIYLANLHQSPSKLILSIHMLSRLLKLMESNTSYEINYFIEQVKIYISQLNTMESQLKVINNSSKIIQETINNAKKNIGKLLAYEENDDINAINMLETPCKLKKYRGLTKNYKVHISTCKLCIDLNQTNVATV